MNKQAEIGSTYIIYGKMGDMKRFKPVAGTNFCTNIIHAYTYQVRTKDEAEKLNKELIFLNTQGEFELRESK